MAHRPSAYGLTAEVNHKIKNKYNVKAEQECLAWISEVSKIQQIKYFQAFITFKSLLKKISDL